MRRTICRFSRGWPLLAAIALLTSIMRLTAAPDPDGKIVVKDGYYYKPQYPENPSTKRMIELMHEDPSLRMEQWGGLSLPGGGGRAPIMMSIAGKTAPDIMESWFHIIGTDIRQGFLYPLNEWIGEDTNGNGQIDDNEAKWERWKNVPKLWRQVATQHGKVYGIPEPTKFYLAVVFRTDMARAAGLDPNHPPKTWDELIYWCQKLTDPNKQVPGAIIKRGQRGIVMTSDGWMWLPWMHSAGGDPIVQFRTSPKTGKRYGPLSPDTTQFITPEGEDLTNVDPEWKADFSSPQGIASVELYHRLFWMRWLIDPDTREPVNLSDADVKNGWVMAGERKLEFTPDQVITGVARADMSTSGQAGGSSGEMLGRGEVAMQVALVQDLVGAGQASGLDPDLLSWFPVPAGPGGRRVVQAHQHYAVMCEGVGDRPKVERDKVWEALTALTDERVLDDNVRTMVLAGLARFVNPTDLHRLGFDDYLKDVPSEIRTNYEEMANGTILISTEPYMGFWVTMDDAINRGVLSLVIADNGEHFDYVTALKKVEKEANTGVMFGRTEEELNRYRPTARVVFVVMAGMVVFFGVFIVRSFLKKTHAMTKEVYSGWLPWLVVAPALILIALWSYYPLLRGLVMAFQDYKIVGDSKFIGLDNFISLTLDWSFWMSLIRTAYFVFLNITLAFLTPIFLALLLAEVPRGKIFYRTLFFLPQVTSGLVIALLWKLLYDPTANGLLNQFLTHLPFFHIAPQAWLGDPKIAMVCCIIPSVWAGMGMASLIYLAALKGVPEDLYEAAEVDGAGIWIKLTKISMPTLMPLIIINFVGTFIGTFQSMGNIFLLTFGGPGDATMVVGMKIWIEAYNNLRFSMATSMAWVLGSLLIGFTYLQIRMLRKVEFKKAQWD